MWRGSNVKGGGDIENPSIAPRPQTDRASGRPGRPLGARAWRNAVPAMLPGDTLS
jgi:hypothetical protein